MNKAPIVLDAFLILSAGAIALMVALALVGARSPLPQAQVSARGYALRRWWFGILTVAAVAVFIVSVPWFPYPTASQLGAAKHFRIVAEQYAFIIPPVIPAHTPIVFDVTAKDVNHGFGIYGPDGAVIAQVQAMPDYVNHLPLTFDRPGRYTVRCMEYCGIAHSAMQGGFEVR